MGCRSCGKPRMSYRKGLWCPEEDQRLRDYIVKHGLGCWSAVPAKAGELAPLVFSLSPTLLHAGAFCRTSLWPVVSFGLIPD
ncbi:hypothetical protein ABZP36_021674 [Zizania latifolia]